MITIGILSSPYRFAKAAAEGVIETVSSALALSWDGRSDSSIGNSAWKRGGTAAGAKSFRNTRDRIARPSNGATV
jgi:hypothetical protein